VFPPCEFASGCNVVSRRQSGQRKIDDRGSVRPVAVSALEGALPVLAKDHITKERKALKAGKLDEHAVLVELGLAGESEEDSD
jgi:hypothetical protein